MSMLAYVQRAFGPQANSRDEKFAATHTVGGWNHNDSGVVKEEKDEEGITLTMADHHVRIAHAKSQGHKLADMANTCRRAFFMTRKDYPDDEDIAPEQFKSRGVRIPGKSIPLQVSVDPGGALVTDCSQCSVGTDTSHKSVVTWENDEQGRTVPKLKSVPVKTAVLRTEESAEAKIEGEDVPCAGRTLSSGSGGSVHTHAVPFPDEPGANRDLGIGFVSGCLLYTSPSPRDLSTSRMPSSA